MFKLDVIITSNKIFITDNTTTSYLSSYLYNGKPCRQSYKRGYYEVEEIPTEITNIIPERKKFIGYKLISDKFLDLDIPEYISDSDINSDDFQYEKYLGLYEKDYEIIPESIKKIDFIIENVYNFDSELSEPKYKLIHNIQDELVTPEILLQSKPCSISKDASYSIIRNYIKQNINYSVAEITSDYDFCFSVKKRIKLVQPEEYKINLNSIFSKRKPKYEVRYREFATVTCFEIAPKAYQSYPVVEEFKGNSYKDLENNIATYLENLIREINTPLVECPCCHGKGYTSKI